MPGLPDRRERLVQAFGTGGGETWVVSASSRVNLIGKHIDYHGLRVLPVAIPRRIRVAFRAGAHRRIRAVSTIEYGLREREWTLRLSPVVALRYE